VNWECWSELMLDVYAESFNMTLTIVNCELCFQMV